MVVTQTPAGDSLKRAIDGSVVALSSPVGDCMTGLWTLGLAAIVVKKVYTADVIRFEAVLS